MALLEHHHHHYHHHQDERVLYERTITNNNLHQNVDELLYFNCSSSSTTTTTITTMDTSSDGYDTSNTNDGGCGGDVSMCITNSHQFGNDVDSVKCMIDKRLLLNDDRLFNNIKGMVNLLKIEHKSYFKTIQVYIKPYMRKMVVSWMLEVCEEEKCDQFVFSLAVYLLDKFLCVYQIKPNIFQLIASTCLFISSKLFMVVPLSAHKLVFFTDNSINVSDIIEMELFLLDMLKWDVIYVTPIEYLDYLMDKLKSYLYVDVTIDVNKLKEHCKTLILLATIECECTLTLPDTVTSACLLSAFQGLYSTSSIKINYLYELIVNEIQSNIDDLIEFKQYIDELYINSINKI